MAWQLWVNNVGSPTEKCLERRAESGNASELRSRLRRARRSNSLAWVRRSAPLSCAEPPPSRAALAPRAAISLRSTISQAALVGLSMCERFSPVFEHDTNLSAIENGCDEAIAKLGMVN